MSKKLLLIFIATMVCSIVAFLVLLLFYKCEIKQLLEELFSNIFTGSVIAIPSAVLLLYLNKIETKRKINDLVNDFVKHFNDVDIDDVISWDNKTIDNELSYLQKLNSECSLLFSKCFILKNKARKIQNFMESCTHFSFKLNLLKNQNGVCSDSDKVALKNNLNFCLSISKSINDYQNYLKE